LFQDYTSKTMRAHTHNHFYRPFVQDYPGGEVPEETFTHSHPSWSSDILYQLPPSTTIHSILRCSIREQNRIFLSKRRFRLTMLCMLLRDWIRLDIKNLLSEYEIYCLAEWQNEWMLPSVLWRCWLGVRKDIRPVKNWVVECWHGYLFGVRRRLAYGPTDPDWFYLSGTGPPG